MRRGRILKPLSRALLLCLAALGSGCGLVDIDMTSTPATVRWGEPVTFDIKFTNRSECPVKTAVAGLAPFIPIQQFNAIFLEELPPDASPEEIAILNALRAYFDELCTGGDPPLPELPAIRTACTRGPDEVVCTATGPATAQTGGGGSRTFATLGNRLACEVDAGTMQCTLRIPFPSGATAEGSAAVATQSLSCQAVDDLGLDPSFAEGFGFLCFVGSFPAIQGLAPGEMATGQFTLPARGSGVVRNLIFGISETSNEQMGVCRGGSNAGGACDQDDQLDDCPDGGVCLEGICVNGPSQGQGCDQGTEEADCGTGFTCALCSEPTGGEFLPIDCTTTYIVPNPAPMASAWGLAALAVALCAAGVFWLRRRAG